MDPELRSRAEAIRLGVRRYYTGIPCKHGHRSERYTTTGSCLECLHPKLSRPRVITDPRRLSQSLAYSVDRRLSAQHVIRLEQWVKDAVATFEVMVEYELVRWCPICNGSGKFFERGAQISVRHCPWCQGSGIEAPDALEATKRWQLFKKEFPKANPVPV